MNAVALAQTGYDPYADCPDTGGFFLPLMRAVHLRAHRAGFSNHYLGRSDAAGFFSSIAHAVTHPGQTIKSAAHTLTHPKDLIKAANPLNLVKAGIDDTKLAAKGTVYVAKKAAPVVAKALPVVQTVLKNAGPIGMVASGAIGAMKAGLSGKNLESIAWAAAEGAAPSGIDTAIQAAEGLRHGKSVLTTALNAAATGFTPASPEKLGFDTAVNALKNSASKVALGVARKALPTEGARRAFDSAVGVVSTAAKGAPDMANLVQRANSIPNVILKRVPVKLSAVPSATQNVLDAVRRNPALMAGNRQLLAQTLRTNAATVNDALRIAAQKPGGMLPWRSMQPHVVAFILKYAPNAPITALRHAHTNVGGLDSTGTTYIVEKGDGPWAIAQKLSGNGSNWKMLLDYNKDKKPTVDKNVWVGEVLNLPPSWQKPVAKTAPPRVALPLPPVPNPTIAPTPDPVTAVTQATNSIVPSILQAKAILAAWGKTDGINQAGLTDYGLNPSDMATSMGPRDTMMLQSFQVWDNKTLNDSLNVSGTLDSASLTALQSWATARATAAVSPSPAVAAPGSDPISTSPLPVVLPGGVVGGTTSPTGAPQVASKSNPATGGSGGMIAGGAVIGGLLFGLPGALIGAAAGAAVS